VKRPRRCPYSPLDLMLWIIAILLLIPLVWHLTVIVLERL
jgi:hypothetical protein